MTDINDLKQNAWREKPVVFNLQGQEWKTFATYEDAKSWLIDTRQQTEAIMPFLTQKIRQQLHAQWGSVLGGISILDRNDLDLNTLDATKADLSRYVESLFSFCENDKPSLDRLIAISEQHSPTTAAAYWSTFHNWDLMQPNMPETQLGVMLGYIDSGTLSANAFSKLNTMTVLHDARHIKKKIASWFVDQKEQFRAAKQKADNATRIATEVSQHQTIWRKRHVAASKRYRRLFIAHSKDQLDTIKQHYNSELALQAPVTYWQEKVELHRDKARIYGWALGAAMAVTFLLVGCLSLALIVPIENNILVRTLTGTALGSATPSTINPFAKATAFAAVLALLFWVLRILNRNVLSHQHLASDAQERVVMTQTYLSLQRDDRLPDNVTLDVILSALFRSSSDGFVKEDHGPTPPILDLILNRNK